MLSKSTYAHRLHNNEQVSIPLYKNKPKKTDRTTLFAAHQHEWFIGRTIAKYVHVTRWQPHVGCVGVAIDGRRFFYTNERKGGAAENNKKVLEYVACAPPCGEHTFDSGLHDRCTLRVNGGECDAQLKSGRGPRARLHHATRQQTTTTHTQHHHSLTSRNTTLLGTPWLLTLVVAATPHTIQRQPHTQIETYSNVTLV